MPADDTVVITRMDIPSDFQDILRRHLPFSDAGELSEDDDLSDLGLDSMGLVALMADIEDSYDVELPDEFVAETTFATVGSLWRAVLALPAAWQDARLAG